MQNVYSEAQVSPTTIALVLDPFYTVGNFILLDILDFALVGKNSLHYARLIYLLKLCFII